MRSFSFKMCLSAAARSLQADRCSSFFSNSHWTRCCSSMTRLQSFCFAISAEICSERFTSESSEFVTAWQSVMKRSSRWDKSFMDSSEISDSPRWRRKISDKTEALFSASCLRRLRCRVTQIPSMRSTRAATPKMRAVGPAPSHGDGSGKNARYPQYAAQMAQIAAAIKKNTWKNRDPLLEEDTCAC